MFCFESFCHFGFAFLRMAKKKFTSGDLCHIGVAYRLISSMTGMHAFLSTSIEQACRAIYL